MPGSLKNTEMDIGDKYRYLYGACVLKSVVDLRVMNNT